MYPNFEYLEFHKFYKWLSMSYSLLIFTCTQLFWQNWLEYLNFENIFRQTGIGFWHFWHIHCMFKRLRVWIGWIEGCIQKWRTNTFLIFISSQLILGTWFRLSFCHIYKSCPSHLFRKSALLAFISKPLSIWKIIEIKVTVCNLTRANFLLVMLIRNKRFNWFNPPNKLSSQLSLWKCAEHGIFQLVLAISSYKDHPYKVQVYTFTILMTVSIRHKR